MILGCHISAVLRGEEQFLIYDTLFNLRKERRRYPVEITGLSTYRRDGKEFLVLKVKMDTISEIRLKLNLVSYRPEQSCHITIGERFVN